MNARRYRSYRQALGWIDMIEAQEAPAEAVALLRELAEDLLLTRDHEEASAHVAVDQASVALLHLAAFSGIPRTVADRAWEALRSAGPDSLTAAEDRLAALPGV